MKDLSANAPIFAQLKHLKAPTWWNTLVQDPEISIEIRKENSIDAYYNGGAVISGLKYGKNGFTGKIHYKYLLPTNERYININLDSQGAQLNKPCVDLINLAVLNQSTLNRVKANIANYYPKTSEKGIQAQFIIKSGAFLDSEFAYNTLTDKCRIDLVWVDTSQKKIIFAELKTIGDNRLYNNEIRNQLDKYSNFIFNYQNDLLTYYQTLFLIKKDLGILPHKLLSTVSLTEYQIECKPLLIVGDCTQEWININAPILNKKIDSVATGAYYFGRGGYDCDLILNNKLNRYVFP
jgi:hypothetical protein